MYLSYHQMKLVHKKCAIKFSSNGKTNMSLILFNFRVFKAFVTMSISVAYFKPDSLTLRYRGLLGFSLIFFFYKHNFSQNELKNTISSQNTNKKTKRKSLIETIKRENLSSCSLTNIKFVKSLRFS